MVRSFEVLNELTFPTLRETNPVLTERLRRSRALRSGTLTEYEVYARHPERPANVSGQSRQTQIMIRYCHRDATFARKLILRTRTSLCRTCLDRFSAHRVGGLFRKRDRLCPLERDQFRPPIFARGFNLKG